MLNNLNSFTQLILILLKAKILQTLGALIWFSIGDFNTKKFLYQKSFFFQPGTNESFIMPFNERFEIDQIEA